MTKVLVTGATGFVGACLTRRLVDAGHEVHLCTRAESDRWRIADLLGDVREHEVNLRDRPSVEKAVRSIEPKIICHLATYGGFASQRESTAIYEVNLLGTVNLLRACEQTGFDLFINTGSSSEYGIKSQPMRESDLLEPIGDYGVSKAAASLFCSAEARETCLPIVTLRLFSPFGPWDDPKRLIPFVIKSFLRGEVPKLSTPASVRDYIFIDDVVDSYLHLIENPPVQGEISTSEADSSIPSATWWGRSPLLSVQMQFLNGGPHRLSEKSRTAGSLTGKKRKGFWTGVPRHRFMRGWKRQ